MPDDRKAKSCVMFHFDGCLYLASRKISMLISITSIRPPFSPYDIRRVTMVKVWNEITHDWVMVRVGCLTSAGDGNYISLGNLETFHLGWISKVLLWISQKITLKHPLSLFMIDCQSLTIDYL